MCTFNLTLSDDLMEQVRPAFPTQEALVKYAQQQLENIMLRLAKQQKEKQKISSKIKPVNQLSPEIQEILAATAPLQGTVPEWDLNGDMARSEALKEKYGN